MTITMPRIAKNHQKTDNDDKLQSNSSRNTAQERAHMELRILRPSIKSRQVGYLSQTRDPRDLLKHSTGSLLLLASPLQDHAAAKRPRSRT